MNKTMKKLPKAIQTLIEAKRQQLKYTQNNLERYERYANKYKKDKQILENEIQELVSFISS